MFGKHLVAAITPFQITGDIDHKYFRSFLQLLISEKVETVVIFGTNGEGPSVSLIEVEQTLKSIQDFQREIKVILGVFRTNIADTVNFLKLAENYQVDGLLLPPPFYFKNLNDNGLLGYFTKLFNNCSLPIILYNIPKYTGIPLSANLIQKISEFPHFAGIKETSGDINQTQQFLQKFPDLRIYSGSDDLIHKSLKSGCTGVITALSNIFPSIVNEIIISTSNKQFKEAENLQTSLNKIRTIIKRFPQIASTKTCIEHYLGFPPTYVRPPLINLDEEQKKSMFQEIDNILEEDFSERKR